jgi:hypothetical protein
MMDMTDDGCDGDLYLLGRETREREKTRRAVRGGPVACGCQHQSIQFSARNMGGDRRHTHRPPLPMTDAQKDYCQLVPENDVQVPRLVIGISTVT